MRFTVLGASGFVGSALTRALRTAGCECVAPLRADMRALLEGNENLGHVIWCVGLTADFRERPFDTVRAHVCDLVPWLQYDRYDSFLYLSSTRVYGGCERADESTALRVQPAQPDDLYNLTKLTGEALCLTQPRPAIRVVRLSTVVGERTDAHDFVAALLSEGRATGCVRLRGSADSAKDYIALEDVVELLPRIACAGTQRLYNVAVGRNLTHRQVAEALAAPAGWPVICDGAAPPLIFPPIDIGRIRQEFGFSPRDALGRIASLTTADTQTTKDVCHS